jgi:hypothetical protein
VPQVRKSHWRVTYYWSKSSGLRLGTADYRGKRAIHAAAVPFVYVNYWGDSSGPFTDQLQSKVNAVEVREIMFGFDLKVTYDIYGADYQYDHVWRFLEDGQFSSTIIVQGPGEEVDGRHTYHIPFRIDLDVSGEGGDSFQRRGPAGWDDVEREGRFAPTAPPVWDWRVLDRDSGRSASARARLGDNAELWALRYRRAEAWASWGAAGQGAPGSPDSVPAIYADDQSVQDTNVVLWYIAHVGSVAIPAACGPAFRLDGYGAPVLSEPPMHDTGHHGGMDEGHGHMPDDVPPVG